jgi:two-component system, chemotaxis family, response regulator PixH
MEQAKKASIMVIGADSHFCYLMRRYVKKSANEIIFAYLGDDALALAVREMPAAIVLEIDQPNNNGWTLLHALKNNTITQKIPIVLCSWLDDASFCLEEGADAYLRKPFLYEDFLGALNNLGVGSS